MPDAPKVSAARELLKGPAGPSGQGSATEEERILLAADTGATYGGWTAVTGATGPTGVMPQGPTGPTGPP